MHWWIVFDIFTDMYDLNVAEFVRYTDHLIAFFSFSLTLAALKVVMRVYCRSHYHIMNVSGMFCYYFLYTYLICWFLLVRKINRLQEKLWWVQMEMKKFTLIARYSKSARRMKRINWDKKNTSKLEFLMKLFYRGYFDTFECFRSKKKLLTSQANVLIYATKYIRSYYFSNKTF